MFSKNVSPDMIFSTFEFAYIDLYKQKYVCLQPGIYIPGIPFLCLNLLKKVTEKNYRKKVPIF